MSKEAYIRGFCKVAGENGYDPFELARMAVGFKQLKKAEARLFVKELRKIAEVSCMNRSCGRRTDNVLQ